MPIILWKRYQGIFSIILITLVYIILSYISYTKYGVKVVSDSPRYIEYAQELLSQPFYWHKHQSKYLGYVLFLMFLFKGGLSVKSVIIVQYIVTYLSIIIFYKSINIVLKSKSISLAFTILYLCNFEVIYWNSYILCESFYTAFIIFSLYAFLIYHYEDKKILLPIILFTIIIKPTGIAILLSFLLYVFLVKSNLSNNRKTMFFVILFILFVILSRIYLRSFNVISEYVRGEVVYAVSIYKSIIQQFPYLVIENKNIKIPPEHLLTFDRIILFIVENPIYWLKLFFRKLFFYILHIRPYWSNFHNINSLIVLLPCYALIIFRLIKVGVNRKDIVLIGLIFLNSLIVSCTIVDWDGRFFMPIYPIIILCTAEGYSILKENITVFIKERI